MSAGLFISVFIGLAAGNALFAVVSGGPLASAVEHSFFQGFALLWAYIVGRLAS